MDNHMTSAIDINGMIVDKKLKVSFTYSKNRFSHGQVEALKEKYFECLKQIHSHCTDNDEIELTPSDFDALDISQDDLDMLFSS